MRYMGRGKQWTTILAIVIGGLVIAGYSLATTFRVPEEIKIRAIWRDSRAVHLNDHPDQPIGMLLGGSNVIFGLSAEEISSELGLPVYNMALLNEGFNSQAYLNFLENSISPQVKSRVELLVYSSRDYFNSTMMGVDDWDADELGNYPISSVATLPEKSLLELLQTRKREPRQPRAATEPYGDLDFTKYQCPPRWSPKREDETQDLHEKEFLFETMSTRLKEFRQLFPNARIVVVVPSFYAGYTQLPAEYIEYFDTQFTAEGYIFIAQDPITDKSDICNAAHHPSASGRVIRTHSLIAEIKALGL